MYPPTFWHQSSLSFWFKKLDMPEHNKSALEARALLLYSREKWGGGWRLDLPCHNNPQTLIHQQRVHILYFLLIASKFPSIIQTLSTHNSFHISCSIQSEVWLCLDSYMERQHDFFTWQRLPWNLPAPWWRFSLIRIKVCLWLTLTQETYQFHGSNEDQSKCNNKHICSHHMHWHWLHSIKETEIVMLSRVGGGKNKFFSNVRQLVSDLFLKAHQWVNLAISS